VNCEDGKHLDNMGLMDSILHHKHELLLAHSGLGGDAARLLMAVLNTAQQIDRACANELANFELSEGRLAVLLAIASSAEESTPASVADQLGVTRAAVTGLIDGLERARLIERHAHPEDRRSTVLMLTARGQQSLDRIAPHYGHWIARLTQGVDDAVARTALAALASIQSELSSDASDGRRGTRLDTQEGAQ